MEVFNHAKAFFRKLVMPVPTSFHSRNHLRVVGGTPKSLGRDSQRIPRVCITPLTTYRRRPSWWCSSLLFGLNHIFQTPQAISPELSGSKPESEPLGKPVAQGSFCLRQQVSPERNSHRIPSRRGGIREPHHVRPLPGSLVDPLPSVSEKKAP